MMVKTLIDALPDDGAAVKDLALSNASFTQASDAFLFQLLSILQSGSRCASTSARTLLVYLARSQPTELDR